MTLRLGLVARVFAGALLVVVSASAGADDGPRREVAPAFQARTLDGRVVSLAALLSRGPVVLDFWATWCRPCERSLPALQALHARYAERGVTVLAISIDGPRNWARVRPFVAAHGLTLPVAIDEDGAIAKRYRIASVPASVVIAPDGRVVRFHAGYVPGDEQALEVAVRAALGEPADSAR